MDEKRERIAEVIKMAIQMEKDGHKFFMDKASQTESTLGKKMFERLAKEELQHIATFTEMFDQILESKEWHKLIQRHSLEHRMPVFEEAVNREPVEVSENDVQALDEALDLERRAIEFFKDAMEKSEDETAKELFGSIMKEEEYHYMLIQAQRDALTNAGFWFDDQEFQMDGKF
jgi:rubrerythrin